MGLGKGSAAQGGGHGPQGWLPAIGLALGQCSVELHCGVLSQPGRSVVPCPRVCDSLPCVGSQHKTVHKTKRLFVAETVRAAFLFDRNAAHRPACTARTPPSAAARLPAGCARAARGRPSGLHLPARRAPRSTRDGGAGHAGERRAARERRAGKAQSGPRGAWRPLQAGREGAGGRLPPAPQRASGPPQRRGGQRGRAGREAALLQRCGAAHRARPGLGPAGRRPPELPVLCVRGTARRGVRPREESAAGITARWHAMEGLCVLKEHHTERRSDRT